MGHFFEFFRRTATVSFGNFASFREYCQEVGHLSNCASLLFFLSHDEGGGRDLKLPPSSTLGPRSTSGNRPFVMSARTIITRRVPLSTCRNGLPCGRTFKLADPV